MIHLSGMDAAFLHLESPEMPMHVGSLQILDLPDGYQGEFYEDVKRYLGQRMHLAEVFHRKLELMPFELANPVWVDDDDVDLDHHIRHVLLPRPGTWAQLEAQVARLHSSLMDRSRPLWEVYVIEGLETGQVALYNKMHHATIDGQAGTALTRAILTPSPDPGVVKAPKSRTRGSQGRLGVAELAGAAISNAFEQYVKLIKALPDTAKTLGSVLMPPSGPDANAGLKTAGNMQSAPKTPLNVAVTNQRSFAARSIPLAEVKAIAKSSGTSLNDVVLALCAGALRRYLAEYNCKPRKPLIAGVPVSLRDTGNTDPTNQVAMILVSLATDIADPAARLATISASASAGKQLTGRLKTAIPMDFPSFGVPWFMSGLASLYGRSRLADKLPPIVNVAISNVPGPQFSLYFAGAKLARWYPVSIPTHGVALNVTVLSYDGSLEIGLTACRSAVPDVADLGNYIVEEHNMLLAAMRSRNANAMDEATALAEPVEAKQLPSERPSTRVATRKPVSRAKDQQEPTGRTESPQRRKGTSTSARGTRASHG